MATEGPGPEWIIEFNFENSPQVSQKSLGAELVIGRADGGENTFVGLDLTPFGGDELGVSRRHALIHRQGDRVMIHDLHSSNGTTLNGKILEPEVDYLLKDGNALRLGDLQITVHIFPDIGPTSILGKRTDFSRNDLPIMMRGQQVIVVEDEQLFAELYRTTLEEVGFSVQICHEVVSAVRILNHQTPSLILLDLMLPNVTGLELCRYVRRDMAYPSLPILVVSARTDPEAVKQALEAGANVYLAKPVNPKELVQIASALVQQNEAHPRSLGTKQLGDLNSPEEKTSVTREFTIILFIEGSREPVTLVIDEAVILGRRGDTTQEHQKAEAHKPGFIDLQPYDAFEKGVSRVHAKLRHDGQKFLFEDLESSNGTFVNGMRLSPNDPHILINGDEIRLGRLRLAFYRVTEETSPKEAT
ncbi:MAG: FHA domain-containing protein [Chloroflexi bacterium]|nr:FHA domain-containing protein [Chloroflexota bacterium]